MEVKPMNEENNKTELEIKKTDLELDKYKIEFISVEEEYKKNPDLKKEDVVNLMAWAEKQLHLPKISELEIILFLHSCFYSHEQAKHTIETYYTCRSNCEEIFGKWDTLNEKLQKDMDVMIFQPMPGMTDEGHKIIFLKFLDSDASKFNVADQIRVFLMSMKLWLMEEGTAQGHVVLMDMSGITTGHLIRLQPLVIKKFFYFLQEAIPFRLKGFHFFDCLSIIDKVMLIIRPFIKEDVLHIHTKENVENLYKYFPKRCLPEDYGGEQPSVDKLHATMKERLIKNAAYLKNVEISQKIDESLRQGTTESRCVIS